MEISILAPTKKAKELFKDLGIAWGENAVAAKGWLPYLTDIYKAIGTNSEALHILFPRQEAFLGFYDLFVDSGKAFNDTLAYNQNSIGATAAAYAHAIKSFTLQFEHFKNQVKALALTLGDILMPILIKLMNGVMKFVIAFRELPDATKEAIIKFAIFAAALGPILLVGGQVVVALGAIVGMLSSVVGAMLAVAAPLVFLAAGFFLWKGNILGVQSALDGLTKQEGTLGKIAIIFETLFEILLHVGRTTFELQGIFSTATGEAANFAEVASTGIKEVARNIVELRAFIEALILTFQQFIDDNVAFWPALVNMLKTGAIPAIQTFATIVGSFWDWQAKASVGDLAGTTAAWERLKTAWEKMPEIPGVFESLDKLNKPLAENVKLYDAARIAVEAKKQVDLAYINGLNVTRIIQDKVNLAQSQGASSMNMLGATFAKGVKQIDPLVNLLEDYNKGLHDLENTAGGSYDSIGKDAQAMRDKVVGAYADMLKAGEAWAARLAPETAAKILDPFSPNNPDSPFQPFFRILDVAEHWGPGKKPGVDTAKWAEMYFPGMSAEEQAAGAKEISKKFMTGYWDPAMRAILGPEGIARMREIAKEQKITEALRLAFAELIAGDGGVQAGIIADAKSSPLALEIPKAILGTGDPKAVQAATSDITDSWRSTFSNMISGEAGLQAGIIADAKSSPLVAQIPTAILGFSDPKVVQGATDDMLGTLLPAISQSITDNQENLASKGGQVWGALESGIIQAAKDSGVLYKAVQAAVATALASAMGP